MNATADKVGFVPEPNGRGTIGLLWSCFATIFLCTWSAIHPNLPAIDDSPSRIFWRKVGYMLLAVIAPEYVAFCAFIEYSDARVFKKKVSGEPWKYTQYHHFLMGGFTVQHDPHDPSNHQCINPTDLLGLLETKVVEMPYTENSYIEDRSKANWFTRSITLLQVAWFIVQLSGRAAQRLPVSTLELFTLGLVICAAFTYILWWNKPLDVQKPVVLKLSDGKRIPPTLLERCRRVGFANGPNLDNNYMLYFTFIVSVTLFFGAAHVIGWNFEFPTGLESLLWRISSLCSVILPIALLGIIFLRENKFQYYSSIIVGVLYVIVRLYLFAEMFAGLRDAPAGLYQTPQWSQYFPALG
ncbi:hypothetical protein BS50DRAFT_545993 [Corynespora cassiicola Philippines]|uniref:Uncharacterized protein n=1 Tax=Corynespora cassiicola Philippines TaxID=1448308 RepID=A0A2T2NZX9_CORCC|nr:hypothetical protein BS50DRAFT_545993 [Corynespora cassiicola Philippines]